MAHGGTNECLAWTEEDAAAAVTGGFLACLLHGIAALVLGTAVSFVLKQIPGLKKLI